MMFLEAGSCGGRLQAQQGREVLILEGASTFKEYGSQNIGKWLGKKETVGSRIVLQA